MSVNQNIRRLRKNADMTQEQLAEKCNVARSTVTQWESGWSKPRMGMVEKLAAIFNVQVSAIVDSEVHIPKGAITPQVEANAYLPLLGTAHAGKPTDPEHYKEMIALPQSVADAHRNGFFLKVEGDCMDKVYPEGCLILIDPDKQPGNGSIAAVMIDGNDVVMRKLYRGANTLILSPDSFNPEHEDIVITANDERIVELVGTVVWFQSNGEME